MASSSSAGQRRVKDAAMAARMKSEKIVRDHARCPICYGVISLHQLYNHIAFHK